MGVNVAVRSLFIPSLSINPAAAVSARAAFEALADTAAAYLTLLDGEMDAGESAGESAWVSHVRGTGPGVSFGALVAAIESSGAVQFQRPFEGSMNVSGAPLAAAEFLRTDRDDGLLFLRFESETVDLPLHIHPLSDRFIFVIGGRGFFHVANKPLEVCEPQDVHHIAARDRDVFMFRRGVVHTFSTASHPLMLLSYHRPFIELDDDTQYQTASKPLTPRAFRSCAQSRVTIGSAWSSVATCGASHHLNR